MIKAVFFDLYNTLIHYEPPPEEQQTQACRAFGIEVERQAIRHGYWAANEFLTHENARLAIQKRSEEEQREFWIDWEATLLRKAGVNVSRELASQILDWVRQTDRKLVLYPDVLPTLTLLRSRGLTLGLISNLERSLEHLCTDLGLSPYLDFILISHEVGFEKPHPEIFLTALERAKVQASEAIHVGDQYHADVVGARQVGIKPLLLDRDGLFADFTDCERIQSLEEIMRYI